MSELSLSPYPNRIENPNLAEVMAFAEKPHRELAIQAAETAGKEYLAQTQQSLDQALEIGSTTENKESISAERIGEILHNSGILVYGWFDGSSIPEQKREAYGGQFMRLFNQPELHMTAMSKVSPNEDLGRFLIHRITEVVTIRDLYKDVTMKQANPYTYKPDEPVMIVDYELSLIGKDSRALDTLKKEDYMQLKNEYQGATSTPKGVKGLPANDNLKVRIYMATSDAGEFVNAVRQNPQTVRDAVDIAMRQEIEADKNWDELGGRPPYEKWKELNGGINRIALRYESPEKDDHRKGPEESEILEF